MSIDMELYFMIISLIFIILLLIMTLFVKYRICDVRYIFQEKKAKFKLDMGGEFVSKEEISSQIKRKKYLRRWVYAFWMCVSVVGMMYFAYQSISVEIFQRTMYLSPWFRYFFIFSGFLCLLTCRTNTHIRNGINK